MIIKAWTPVRAGFVLAALGLMSPGFILGQSGTNPDTGTLEQSIRTGVERTEDARQTDERVSEIAGERDRLLSEYRSVLRQLETVRSYNDQMQAIVDEQESEIDQLEGELGQLADTQREILPMLLRMIDTLDTFIERDTPFLLEERNNRVADLREMMDRGDITLAEKFRQVFAAYQTENDYSRNIEAYKAAIVLGGRELTVEFLRVGRLGLYYQSLDGELTGWWNPDARSFEKLEGDRYRVTIGDALSIAKKQAAQDLLKLPVPAPTEVE